MRWGALNVLKKNTKSQEIYLENSKLDMRTQKWAYKITLTLIRRDWEKDLIGVQEL